MSLMIDAESLLPLLEARTKAYAHRTKVCEDWQALDDNTARVERLDAFEVDYRNARVACVAADDNIVCSLEVLVWAAENNI